MHTVIIGGTHGLGRQIASRLKGHVSVIGRTAPDPEPYPVPEWYSADLVLDDDASVVAALDRAQKPFLPVTGIVFAHRYRGSDAWRGELAMVSAVRSVFEWARSHCESGAAIVALTSPASTRVITEQDVSYHVGKAALLALVRYYAVALASREIRVNAIAPSATVQPRCEAYYADHPAFAEGVPVKRLGTASDLARLVAFLLSDHAKFLTGQELNLDGGISLLHPHSLLKAQLDTPSRAR